MTTLASITKFVGINFSGGAGGPSARFGTLSLSFARFGSDTDDDSDYTDINSYVLSMKIARGRARELEEFAAGSCIITLDNSDGRFDPGNSGSPYSGNIQPGKQLRIKFTDPTSSTVYYLFQGNISTWNIDYNFPNMSVCQIVAYDGLRALSRNTVAVTTSNATTNVGIKEILEDADYFNYSLDTGNSTLQAKAFSNQNALQAAQLLTNSEGLTAKLYADKENQIVFKNRHAIYTDANSKASQATFGAGSLPIEFVDTDFDDQLIKNKISITREGGAAQTATDSSSISAYNESSYARTGLLMETNSEALDYANTTLQEFKDPEIRCKSIKFSPLKTTALLTQSLSRAITDRVTVQFSPPNADAFDKELIIGGISHTITPENWVTEFKFSSSNTDNLTALQLGPIDGTNYQFGTGTFFY